MGKIKTQYEQLKKHEFKCKCCTGNFENNNDNFIGGSLMGAFFIDYFNCPSCQSTMILKKPADRIAI